MKIRLWASLLFFVMPNAQSLRAEESHPSKVKSAKKVVSPLPEKKTKDGEQFLLNDEQRDYSRAADLLKNGKESEALVSLSDYLRRYPTSRLAPEAQYLMGEVFFKQRKYQDAIGEYLKVHKYGNLAVDKAPWASVKIGECWYQLKFFDRARIEWEAIRRRFPNTEAAESARSHLAGVP